MRGKGTAVAGCIVLTALCGCSNVRREAAQLTGGRPDNGVELIGRYGCAACHTIPGIRGANATVGPPLTRIASRTFLAGQIHNTPGNMVRWIQHPREVERGTAMPEMGVTDSDARDIAAYLYTLR
jgi:cytochrome c2